MGEEIQDRLYSERQNISHVTGIQRGKRLKGFSVTDIVSASRVVRVIKNLAHANSTQVSQGVIGWLGWSHL